MKEEISITSEEIALEIGLRLRFIRESRDLQIDDMAEVMDVSPAQYLEFEEGKTIPGALEAFYLHKVLYVDINWLFAGESEDTEGNVIPLMRVVDNNPSDEGD